MEEREQKECYRALQQIWQSIRSRCLLQASWIRSADSLGVRDVLSHVCGIVAAPSFAMGNNWICGIGCVLYSDCGKHLMHLAALPADKQDMIGPWL